MNHERRMVKLIIGDGSPIRTLTPDRNAKCACGSGRKFKHCHGTETKYFSTKPKEKSDFERKFGEPEETDIETDN
jgi:hypothetical protein